MSTNKEIVNVLKSYPGITAHMDLSESSPLVIDLGRVAKTHIKKLEEEKQKSKISGRAIYKHPLKHKYELALYLSDYFGTGEHGVKFDDGKTVYAIELVDSNIPMTFWAEDVKNAFLRYIVSELPNTDHDEILVVFLNNIELNYKARWNRDPEGGEGAVEWYSGLLNGNGRL